MGRLASAFTAAFLLATAGSLPTSAQPPSGFTPVPDSGSPAFLVDCGGPAFKDARGRSWEADAHFTGGGTISYPGKIKGAGADMQVMYQSERYYDPAKPPLKYNFTVATGNYFVRLHFAETYPGFNKAGYRVFDVTLNGETVLKSFDISGLVGVDSAMVREFTVHATVGKIDIGFINRVEHAKISGIEILPFTPVGLRGLHRTPGVRESSGIPRDVRGRAAKRAAHPKPLFMRGKYMRSGPQ